MARRVSCNSCGEERGGEIQGKDNAKYEFLKVTFSQSQQAYLTNAQRVRWMDKMEYTWREATSQQRLHAGAKELNGTESVERSIMIPDKMGQAQSKRLEVKKIVARANAVRIATTHGPP